MKKIITAILIITCMIGTSILVGCNSSKEEENKPVEVNKLKIMVTNFSEYEWVREILGDNMDQMEVEQIIDGGVDLHSFSPTVEDIAKIASCDLFIYTGGVSSSWVDEVLEQATNQDMVVLNLMEVLGDKAKLEEVVEGMEESEHNHDHNHEEGTTEEEHDHDHEEGVTEEEHDHDHEDEATEEHDHDHEDGAAEEEHDHDHEDEATEEEHDHEDHVHEDEHIWLSLKNAMLFCNEIAKVLCELDPNSLDMYSANATAYINQLAELDAQYHETVILAKYDTLIFGDRFPFLYLVSDYGIKYYAAFPGCSAETEASFETIVFLAEKVDELEIPYLMTTETGHEIAEVIVDNTSTKNQEIVQLNSLQSSSKKDGKTYIEIMSENLEVLKKVLN